MPEAAVIRTVLAGAAREAGVWETAQEQSFPVIIRSGINEAGKQIRYYFNYSGDERQIRYSYSDGVELLSNSAVKAGESLSLPAWGVAIIEA
ncbi:hypothetical protein D3C86_1921760 [compost metagenome]